jgi:hypothetical protein
MDYNKLNMKKILFLLLISTAAFGQAGPPYNGSSRSINTTPQGDELGTIVRQVPQDIDRIGFTKVLSNSVDSDWGTIVSGIGAGQDVDQTGGNLVITTGTTARSETIIRSTEGWQGGIRLRARSTLSSRIINTNFFIELVDVIGDGLAYTISSATVIVVTFPSGHGFTAENVGQSMYLGLFSGTGTFLSGRYPIASVSGDNITFTVSGFAAGTGTCSAFGWNYYQLHYTGTTATNANFDTQRNGWATGATNATINTTASPGHLAIITGNDLIATFADQLVASATTIQQTVRANRNENIPDDKNLRLQIRIANGSTAPASSITWTIGLISVSHYANTDVAIQDVKAQGLVALPVEILRSTTNAVTVSSGTLTTVSTLSNTTQLTPGTAAANLAKGEDNVAASADVGVYTLGVHRAGPTLTSQNAAGDYSEFAVDDGGAIWMRRRPLTYSRLTADGQVKATAGHLQTITISPTGTVTAGVITIYDSATETGTVIFSCSLPVTTFTPFTVTLDVAALTAIYVGYDATVANVQVTTTFR